MEVEDEAVPFRGLGGRGKEGGRGGEGRGFGWALRGELIDI